jgi:putative ABC transport system substrate-binding protein
MNRREFISLLGGAAFAWSPRTLAQQSYVPVIGFFSIESSDPSVIRLRAFRQDLNETGFVVGKNIAIEYRCPDDRYDRLPTMVADLVARRVDIIHSATDPATSRSTIRRGRRSNRSLKKALSTD